MTSPEVTENDVTETGNDSIGSDESVREIMFCAFFFLTGFLLLFFSSETPRGLLGNFWEFPIRILPAEISTNENLGNSTNEMPQSLFYLTNDGSPYRSNESVRTIYFSQSLNPFHSSNQIQTFTFVFPNLKIVIFAPTFIVTRCVYLVEYSGEFIFEQR